MSSHLQSKTMLLAGDVGGTKTFMGLFAQGAVTTDAATFERTARSTFPGSVPSQSSFSEDAGRSA